MTYLNKWALLDVVQEKGVFFKLEKIVITKTGKWWKQKLHVNAKLEEQTF